MAVFALAILAAGAGATVNLRGLIASEIESATASTGIRLKTAVCDIRRKGQAGRESSERRMAELRTFISDLRGRDGDDDGRTVRD